MIILAVFINPTARKSGDEIKFKSVSSTRHRALSFSLDWDCFLNRSINSGVIESYVPGQIKATSFYFSRYGCTNFKDGLFITLYPTFQWKVHGPRNEERQGAIQGNPEKLAARAFSNRGGRLRQNDPIDRMLGNFRTTIPKLNFNLPSVTPLPSKDNVENLNFGPSRSISRLLK